MSGTTLICVRHGETEWNVQQRYQGYQDSPLTAVGIAQAASVATRLSPVKAAALYTSDLGRAMQTAKIISEAMGLNARQEKRLRERNMGIFEGLTMTEIADRHPQEWQRFLARDTQYRIPGGQSAEEHARESMSGLASVAEAHVGQIVVVVTHGGVLGALLRQTLGIGFMTRRAFVVPSGSLNVFNWSAGWWCLHTWGDIQHLEVASDLRRDGG